MTSCIPTGPSKYLACTECSHKIDHYRDCSWYDTGQSKDIESDGKPLAMSKTYTLEEVKRNKSIGWFVDGGVVKQVMTLSPGNVRVVGELREALPNNNGSGNDTEPMPPQPNTDSLEGLDEILANYGGLAPIGEYNHVYNCPDRQLDAPACMCLTPEAATAALTQLFERYYERRK